MNRIEMNCQTGELKVIELTAEEIAEIEAKAAYVEAVKEAPPTLVDQILDDPAELAKLKTALGLDRA